MHSTVPNRRRVLVVDDESMVTDWLKMVINKGRPPWGKVPRRRVARDRLPLVAV
jgi:hypothetical protein